VVEASAPDAARASSNSRGSGFSEPAVGVGDDDQPQPALAERDQHRDDFGLDVLPEVVLGVVLAERGQRAIRPVGPLHAHLVEDQVEVHPAAPTIVGRADDRGLVERPHRERLGRGEACGAHLDAGIGQGPAHAGPVGVDEHAPGIEEEGVDGHRRRIW
jgi:hypothetical protein